MQFSPQWLRLLSVLRRWFCCCSCCLLLLPGVCNCSMFCCALFCVRSGIAIILMGKKELVALLNLWSWCLMMVEGLFLVVPQGCLRFVIVVFPDRTHLLFKMSLDVHYLIWIHKLAPFLTSYETIRSGPGFFSILIGKQCLQLECYR